MSYDVGNGHGKRKIKWSLETADLRENADRVVVCLVILATAIFSCNYICEPSSSLHNGEDEAQWDWRDFKVPLTNDLGIFLNGVCVWLPMKRG